MFIALAFVLGFVLGAAAGFFYQNYRLVKLIDAEQKELERALQGISNG